MATKKRGDRRKPATQQHTLDDVISDFRGKGPDEIAAMVRRRGLKGRMGTTYNCPMAIMLDNTYTGQFVIGRKYIVRRSGAKIEKARTPDAVAKFVRKFDVGGYPDMIAPPLRCMAKQPKRSRKPDTRKGDRSITPRVHKRVVINHIGKLVGRFHATDAE